MRILERYLYHLLGGLKQPTSSSSYLLTFGPFNSSTQRRWKKPIDSAQTRLENRTIDLKLNNLTSHLKTLTSVLQIIHLMSNRRRCRESPFLSVQSMSKWKNIVGLNVGISQFLTKYPHVFQLFTHPGPKRTFKCGPLIDAYNFLHKEKDMERGFSWFGNPIGKYHGKRMRIDYFVTSEKLKDRIAACEMHGQGIELEGFYGSDHCPVSLELSPQSPETNQS